MIPNRIWSRYLLVKTLWQAGERERCGALARELMLSEVKVHSRAVEEIRDELRVYAAL